MKLSHKPLNAKIHRPVRMECTPPYVYAFATDGSALSIEFFSGTRVYHMDLTRKEAMRLAQDLVEWIIDKSPKGTLENLPSE